MSDYVREAVGEKPINCVGLGNAQWVAIDYADVIVHIFTPETRAFYDIETPLGGCQVDYSADLD